MPTPREPEDISSGVLLRRIATALVFAAFGLIVTVAAVGASPQARFDARVQHGLQARAVVLHGHVGTVRTRDGTSRYTSLQLFFHTRAGERVVTHFNVPWVVSDLHPGRPFSVRYLPGDPSAAQPAGYLYATPKFAHQLTILAVVIDALIVLVIWFYGWHRGMLRPSRLHVV